MRIIILAAGQSRRFVEAGYHTPKPFLKIRWRGRTESMLSHVLRSVPLGFQITVGIPPGYSSVTKHMEEDWPNVWFKEVGKTTGPGHTLRLLIEESKSSILVLDSDIINYTNDLVNLHSLNKTGVLVSRSTNPACSYVTNLGSFFHIKEKECISPFAVRGAYFVSMEDLSKFSDYLDTAIATIKEPFISHALDLLPISKFAMETSYVPIDWGTPDDVGLSGACIVKE